jgi:outer membrane protein TolC
MFAYCFRAPAVVGALRLAAIVVAAFTITLTVALAQTQPELTLDQALRLAQDRSRQLPARDAAAAASRDMAVVALQRPDPVLKASITNLPVDGPDRFSLTRDFMTMRSIGVMQEFTREDKRKARSGRLEREADVAEADRNLALANLQRDTASAWLERHYQTRMREVLIAQRAEAGLQIEAADAAYRGGRGAQADVFLARSAVARIDDRIAQVQQQIDVATTRLARWIGPVAEAPLGAPPAMDGVRLHEQSLDAQLAWEPRVVLLARQEAMAQADVEVAQTSKKSDISVEVMLSQRGPAYSNMASFNLSMPLQWDQKNRQDREVAAKLAVVDQVRLEREEATRMVVAEALAMLQEWRSDQSRLTRYRSTILPLAAERTHASLAAYRGGNGPLKAVLESRFGEIDTRLEALGLEMNAARLWARLNYLVPVEPNAPSANRP